MAFATAQQGTHDQLIVGTSGSEVLYAGPNDTLEGGSGQNLYIVNLGSGHNTIAMPSVSFVYSKFDTLEFGPGIKLSDLVFTRGVNPNDLLISIAGTQDSVLIEGQFNYTVTGVLGNYWSARIDALSFADGTSVGGDELIPLVIAQEESSGASTVYGSPVDDVLDAGPGARTVSGGDGNDLYTYDRGYGAQTFYRDSGNILLPGSDTVQFGADITQNDLVFSRDPSNLGDLLITIAGTQDTLDIKGQFTATFTGVFGTRYFNRFDALAFADGTSLQGNQINLAVIANEVSSGAATVFGTQADDVLDAGPGARTVSGGDGNDLYVFKRDTALKSSTKAPAIFSQAARTPFSLALGSTCRTCRSMRLLDRST